MNYRPILLLLLGLLLKSCCRNSSSTETARYELSTSELELIPYQEGEKINFIHSNGYAFDLEVVEDNLEWEEEYDFCEWFCCDEDYYSYQVKSTALESSYPEFKIQLSVGGESSYYLPQLIININNNYYYEFSYNSNVQFICDTTTNTQHHDTLQVNNKAYYDVYENSFISYTNNTDTTVLVPKSVCYNKSFGLIQIKMSNDETYSINN